MYKILVIRNDKLGDFMLAWPAFALLKQAKTDLKLTALVPQYTVPLAEICPYLDDVIIDVADKKDKKQYQALLQRIQAEKFDAVISFVSDWHNAKLVWQSGIPYRLAPATKLFQFLYNKRLIQRRSQSAKAEFEYNIDLARRFLQDNDLPITEIRPPYFTFEKSAVETQRVLLSRQFDLPSESKWVFVHSGSGGSANNLSLHQYAELIKGMLDEFDCYIVLTAGPNESEKAHKLAELVMCPKRVVVYDQNAGLVDFSLSLACADLFVSGSTGPLHICGALNVPTIGFYPSRLSAIPRRWRPINAPERHLAFCPPPEKAVQMDLTVISITNALLRIIPFIRHQWYDVAPID